MATTKVTLEADTWTLISTADCHFQNLSNKDVYVREDSALPTTTTEWKLVEPKRIYIFEPATALNLYAYCPGNVGSISYDLI